jgi:hypothetical protein
MKTETRGGKDLCSSSGFEFRRDAPLPSLFFARENISLLKHLYEAWVVNLKVLKAEDLCFRDFGLH